MATGGECIDHWLDCSLSKQNTVQRYRYTVDDPRFHSDSHGDTAVTFSIPDILGKFILISFWVPFPLEFFTEETEGHHTLLLEERRCHQISICFSFLSSSFGGAGHIEKLSRLLQFDLPHLTPNWVHTPAITGIFFPMLFIYSVKSLATQPPSRALFSGACCWLEILECLSHSPVIFKRHRKPVRELCNNLPTLPGQGKKSHFIAAQDSPRVYISLAVMRIGQLLGQITQSFNALTGWKFVSDFLDRSVQVGGMQGWTVPLHVVNRGLRSFRDVVPPSS